MHSSYANLLMRFDGNTAGLFIALFAKALEIDLPLGNLVTMYFPADAQTLIDVHLLKVDIVEGAAVVAFEMAVKGQVGVIADFILLNGYGRNQAFSRQRFKGVVYSRFRKSRDLPDDLLAGFPFLLGHGKKSP